MVGNLVIIPKEKKCEYCKEEIESVNQIAKINYPDKNFCCLGCVEKWEEKQKKKPETMGDFLLQDTVENLKNQNEKTIVGLREEIAGLWKENEDLKKELKKDCTECFYGKDEEIKNLQGKIEELKREIEKEKIRADGYRRNSELLASEQAGVKLEKRQVEERLKKAGRFIADALKIAEAESSVFVLLQKVKEVVNNERNI